MPTSRYHPQDLSILDVTIRDGSYAIDYQYTSEMVGTIVGALDAAGIDYIEVSHGCGLGASENFGLPAAASDAEYVRAAKAHAQHARIGVIANAAPATLPRDIDAVIHEVDFIRFATNCDKPTAVASNIAYARVIRPDLAIFLQLMRCNRRGVQEIADAGRMAADMGVDVIYVVDTAGSLTPEEVHARISGLRDACAVNIGFHGHNNLGLAIANTLAAVNAGATAVDASLRGIGRAGGNAQLEALVSLLHRTHHAQTVDLDAVIAVGEMHIQPIMPDGAGIAEIDILTADANIDLYPLDFYETLAAAAGIPLLDLIRTLGADENTVEIDLESLRRALQALDKNAEEIFASLGIKT
jgi:4-hydroxy 2-oxovalerate aldolase/4-hydroxy-2-oxovalerate/4-hydroxy-2-oxohexanoate aldolase